MKRTVLISGASIAGLTLGYWLNTYGFDVKIIEISSSPRKGGSPIDIRADALQVAESMGILEIIKNKQIHTEAISFVGKTGKVKVVTRPPKGNNNREPDIEIERENLISILYGLIKDDITFIFNDSIEMLQQNDSGVEVTFKNGNKHWFDFVIGADGQHSAVRKIVFGTEDKFTKYLGMYVSVAQIEQKPGKNNHTLLYNSPGKIAGISQYDAKTYLFFAFHSPRLNYDYHDKEEQRKLLMNTFKNQRWLVPELLRFIQIADNLYFDSVSQIRMSKWTKDRVSLIGDAAHCAAFLSGMGSSLAMTGARILAEELSSAADNYQAAFQQYENRHKPVVEKIHASVPFTAGMFIPKSHIGIGLRNTLLRIKNVFT